MKRITFFIILVAASIAGLVGILFYTLSISSAVRTSTPASMQDMMSAMMGGGFMAPLGAPFMPFFFLVPFALVAILLAGVIGLVYSSLLPGIRNIAVSPAPQTRETSLAAVMKTLSPEEQKVIEVLMMHEGRYLQKYIVKESGLTRLKVHRILVRFAERGIVTIREYANTNEVTLSEWLQKEREGG